MKIPPLPSLQFTFPISAYCPQMFFRLKVFLPMLLPPPLKFPKHTTKFCWFVARFSTPFSPWHNFSLLLQHQPIRVPSNPAKAKLQICHRPAPSEKKQPAKIQASTSKTPTSWPGPDRQSIQFSLRPIYGFITLENLCLGLSTMEWILVQKKMSLEEASNRLIWLHSSAQVPAHRHRGQLCVCRSLSREWS